MSTLVKQVGHWRRLRKTSSQKDMCEICGKNPKYVEDGFQHPYCGRTCARSANGSNPVACLLYGCRSTGKASHSGFCSETHEREAVQRGEVQSCIQCNTRPQMSGELCSICENRVGTIAQTRLKELNIDGATFKIIANHFNKNWNASKDTATIDKIYEVTVPRHLQMRHSTYRKRLPSPSQTLRTYHSSQCICDLGVHGAVLCDHLSCGICIIVKSSFNEFAFRILHNNGRYGAGIYSYLDPAIADTFATSCTSSPYRVMIACDVIVEAGQLEDAISPIEDPVFVPNADAILPVYILMYHK